MQINNYFRFKTDITYFCQNSEEVKLTYEVSMNIGEQSLFTAVRAAILQLLQIVQTVTIKSKMEHKNTPYIQ